MPSIPRIALRIALACASGKTSASGSISGGSLMIRRRPPATVVSLLCAFMLSLVCALATSFSVVLIVFFFACDRSSVISSSMSRCAYHTSRKCWPANLRIAVR